MVLRSMVWRLKISIHALHEESDFMNTMSFAGIDTFQSTLSMRRATPSRSFCDSIGIFQSTLSMRRATQSVGGGLQSL